MDFGNQAEMEYIECLEIKEREGDLNFLISRIVCNYLLIKDIAQKYSKDKEDASLITLLDNVFHDNIKKIKYSLALENNKKNRV